MSEDAFAALTDPVADEVARLLNALGSTSSQVADTLLSGGHRGQPGHPGCCPIANYLDVTLSDADFGDRVRRVQVEAVAFNQAILLVTVDETQCFPPYAERTVLLPGAVAEFVDEFDHGPRFDELKIVDGESEDGDLA